jgi:hypothetical protein
MRKAAAQAMCAVLLFAAAGESARAQSIPLPRPRPSIAAKAAPQEAPKADDIVQPSACRLRLTAELAMAPSLRPILGPGECGAPDVVRLEAVFLPDRTRIAVTPPATLRCSMAEAIVAWVREEAAPRVLELGAPLRAIENFDSYDCRGRNRVAGAKTSEHGKGNALDIRALRLANGKVVELTDPHVAHSFREELRRSACTRFTTVLGPGSDGYHENHVHVDLAERRSGYRLCQWNIHDPEEAQASDLAGRVPLPPLRPKIEEQARKH